eukprot:scaffold302843_cov22-Tisochrysis_lutea.AAC.1
MQAPWARPIPVLALRAPAHAQLPRTPCGVAHAAARELPHGLLHTGWPWAAAYGVAYVAAVFAGKGGSFIVRVEIKIIGAAWAAAYRVAYCGGCVCGQGGSCAVRRQESAHNRSNGTDRGSKRQGC